MTTITREKIGKVGSCMFCPSENRVVNVISGNGVIVRICDECLGLRLTKRAPDTLKSAPKKLSSNKKGSAKPARG